jgi:Tol biopolymer transport system component/formylglycine-generating enzyme required for sulfatase activity
MIGMATSTDGIHWVKYDNPETDSELFAISDPIFWQVDIGLEDVRIKYPRVRFTPDGWLLFYHTSFEGGGNTRLWLATSQDGISWEPIQDSPILTTGELPNVSRMFMPNVVYTDEKYFVFVELAFGVRTEINLVTSQGFFLDVTARAGIPNPFLPLQMVDNHNTPMILIPAGPFTMGQGSTRNGPAHKVILSDYYIDQFEVSNTLFADFLNENGNQKEGGRPWLDITSSRAEGHLHEVNGVWKPDDGYEDHPVVEVTWFGATAFCQWRDARLPTEAEWEKAARGGEERRFPWGEDANCDYANYRLCGFGETMPIDSYPQGISPYGIHNMAGNASEWTADWYGLYPDKTVVNPQGPEESNLNVRVVRGGSWYSTNMYLITYYRNSEFDPLSSFSNLGFRCAATPTTSTAQPLNRKNQKIAFTSEQDGNFEVYIMGSDGSDLQRLTNHPNEDYWPTWSPDGAQIAFASNREGNFEIYAINVDGSDLRRLTHETGDDLEPDWSPDGTQIAFMVYRDGKSDVFTMKPDGSERKRLTDSDGDNYLPKWSPDGTQLVFVSERDGNPEIYIMDADGGDQKRVTDNPSDDRYPSWSPDGTQIAFYSSRDGNRELYIMEVNGSNPRPLTHDNVQVWVSTWSPDGSQIAFTSNREGNREIYILDIVSGNFQRLTDNHVLDGIPAWRPVVHNPTTIP